MAKRKREIQKRKKQQDSSPDHTGETTGAGASPEDSVRRGDGRAQAGVRKREKPSGVPEPLGKEATVDDGRAAVKDHRLSMNKESLLLGLLVLYVFLLGLGTIGELFEVEWILNLPLFK